MAREKGLEQTISSNRVPSSAQQILSEKSSNRERLRYNSTEVSLGNYFFYKSLWLLKKLVTNLKDKLEAKGTQA